MYINIIVLNSKSLFNTVHLILFKVGIDNILLLHKIIVEKNTLTHYINELP